MSARAARILAQAKVNLRLRVLARQADGYHEIETIFARLALGDELRVRTGVAGRTLDCAHADVGPTEQNLAWRAAMALRDAGGPDSFAIEIEKRIPVGGGLGGGSADAAAVLRALNALSPSPLPAHRLTSIAGTLGADVPYLTTRLPTAIGRGRGDRLTPLESPPPADVLLVIPPFSVSTREAYAWLDESRVGAPAPPEVAVPRWIPSWAWMAHGARNDFEAVVVQRHPELARLRDEFRQSQARLALLSGSGSTYFGVYDRPGTVDAVDRGRFERLGARVVRTRTASVVDEVQLLD
jgi:4-diphosphocytidyl-2-C-methyl-D-erythritol kinase